MPVRVCRKETLSHYFGEWKLVQLLWRTVRDFLKKKKVRPTMRSHQSYSWTYIWKKNMFWKDASIPMFIVMLFTWVRTRKQPTFLSTDEWIKIMCYIHTVEYCSAIKRMKYAFCRVTCYWMDLETITLSDVSQRRQYWCKTILHDIVYMLKQNNNNNNGTS